MRLGRPGRRGLVLAAFFLFALGALLPLRLVVDALGFGRIGLSARAATGSVWFGALQEARLGPVALGDVGARLHFWPLLLGRARLTLWTPPESGGFRGGVTVSRHAIAFDDLHGRLGTGAPVLALPVAAIELDDVSIAFAGARCVRAGGRVRAQAAGAAAGAGLAGLQGVPRCAGSFLLLPLRSPGGMERLDLRLDATGAYRADLAVRPADAAAAARLAAAGLRPAGSTWIMRLTGRF